MLFTARLVAGFFSFFVIIFTHHYLLSFPFPISTLSQLINFFINCFNNLYKNMSLPLLTVYIRFLVSSFFFNYPVNSLMDYVLKIIFFIVCQ